MGTAAALYEYDNLFESKFKHQAPDFTVTTYREGLGTDLPGMAKPTDESPIARLELRVTASGACRRAGMGRRGILVGYLGQRQKKARLSFL